MHNEVEFLHTQLPKGTKNKLSEFGKGYYNIGILNLIKLADSKKITVSIVFEMEI
jgi:hypothetical protein